MSSGILFGVGVGPGDPELMTLKAVRMIREKEYIALPGKVPEETTAYKIAVQAEPSLADKKLVPVYMPMTHDVSVMRQNHRRGADLLEEILKTGKDVVFLTLGDPSVYSTFSYIQRLVEADGFSTRLVSGITSFCAAAALLNTPLAEWNESLHIIPAVHCPDEDFCGAGNYVLMKSGRKLGRVRELLRQSGKDVQMVENCGMPNERVYRSVSEIPDEAGYYSLILAREKTAGL